MPVCANLFPSGKYLMEDFYFAGGLPALLRKCEPHLAADAMTVNGRTLARTSPGPSAGTTTSSGRRRSGRAAFEREDARRAARQPGPDGAVMKSSAASPKFLKHVGPALVFDSPAEMNRTIDDPDLDITEDTVLVLRNAGPVGAPGMPEWGNLPIPKKLLRQGVRDMVRICDGRMSGTHYGTCILHVAPEAAVGGPLALLRTGDLVELDVEAGRLDMQVDEAELERRRAVEADGAASIGAPSRRCISVMFRRLMKAATSISLARPARWPSPHFLRKP